jgi:hypothetical protein
MPAQSTSKNLTPLLVRSAGDPRAHHPGLLNACPKIRDDMSKRGARV